MADYQKYMMSRDDFTERTLKLSDGDEIVIKVRDVSWSRKNQLVSENTSWDAKGNTSFSADGYFRAYIKEMIVEAPWPKTDDSFLTQVGPVLGEALQDLVQEPFDSAYDTETIKKDS